MQILVHLGIFNVDFPINAQIVNENIVTVATFEIPKLNVDDMFGSFISLPEDDAPIEKTKETAQLFDAMDSVGYGSRYFGRIMGALYITILLTTVCSVILLILTLFKSKFKAALTVHTKLKKALLWNFIIRLVYETCIELSFVMILNDRPA